MNGDALPDLAALASDGGTAYVFLNLADSVPTNTATARPTSTPTATPTHTLIASATRTATPLIPTDAPAEESDGGSGCSIDAGDISGAGGLWYVIMPILIVLGWRGLTRSGLTRV